MDFLFETFDVLATAAAAGSSDAAAFESRDQVSSFPDPLGGIGNICGCRQCPFLADSLRKSLPVGLQFVGRAGDDFAVIQAGRTFQSHTDWHKKHPKLH